MHWMLTQCNDLPSWKVKGKTKKLPFQEVWPFAMLKLNLLCQQFLKKNILTFSSGGNGY